VKNGGNHGILDDIHLTSWRTDSPSKFSARNKASKSKKNNQKKTRYKKGLEKKDCKEENKVIFLAEFLATWVICECRDELP